MIIILTSMKYGSEIIKKFWDICVRSNYRITFYLLINEFVLRIWFMISKIKNWRYSSMSGLLSVIIKSTLGYCLLITNIISDKLNENEN